MRTTCRPCTRDLEPAGRLAQRAGAVVDGSVSASVSLSSTVGHGRPPCHSPGVAVGRVVHVEPTADCRRLRPMPRRPAAYPTGGRPTSRSPTAAPSTSGRSRPDDAELVEAFHDRQSRESIYFRYFSPMPTLVGARARPAHQGRLPRPHEPSSPCSAARSSAWPATTVWTGPQRGRGGLHHRRRAPRPGAGHACCSSSWSVAAREVGFEA